MTEVHVDFLGTEKVGDEEIDHYTEWRSRAQLNGEGGEFSINFKEASREAARVGGCKYNHNRFSSGPVCKCHLPIDMVGQDESIFHGNDAPQKEWKTEGKSGLHSKHQGAGYMASAFVSEKTGFGLPMSAEELAAYNVHRGSRQLQKLDESPGVGYITYGKNKEGYWDWEMFKTQVEDYIDCWEWLNEKRGYGPRQLVLVCDWSSGHAAGQSDGLGVTGINSNYGGKQSHMHASKVDAACLGNETCFQTVVGPDGNMTRVKVDRKLAVGDTQEMQFKEATQEPYPNDGPPFDNPSAPRFDRIHATKPKRAKKKPRAKKTQTAQAAAPSAVIEEDNIVEGYAGKPKGAKQILWERGLYKEGEKFIHACIDIGRNDNG